MGLPTLGIKTALRYTGLLPEVDFVTNQVAVGGRARKWRLRRAGITHVLNMRGSPDEKIKGVVNYHSPTKDDGGTKGPEYWARNVEWALQVLQDPKARLYCHCSAGVHRSSGMVYAVLRVQGHSKKKARKMIKKARPKVTSRYFNNVDYYLEEIKELIKSGG